MLLSALGSPLAGQSHLGKDFWLADLHSTAVGLTIATGNPNTATANVTLFNVIDGPTLDTVPVTSGAHKVTSTNHWFGLTVSGFHNFSSYAYPAGLGMPCHPGPDGWMKDVPADDGARRSVRTATGHGARPLRDPPALQRLRHARRRRDVHVPALGARPGPPALKSGSRQH